MHDPDTLICSLGPFLLWHRDPCKGGRGDDSCGWFMRAHHGDPEVLKKIEADIRFDMQSSACPMFSKTGDPVLSTIGVTLNFFFHGAYHHFGSRARALRWMQNNLCEILVFAENPVDSIGNSIQGRYGEDREPVDGRARGFAVVVYGWILRRVQPWWRHPRFHFHHWRITCRPFWHRWARKAKDAAAS